MWLCDSRYGTAAFCGFILSLIVHHKHNPSCVGLMVSHPRGLRNIFSFRFFSLFTSKPKKCEATVLPLKIGEIQMHPTILQIASTSIDGTALPSCKKCLPFIWTPITAYDASLATDFPSLVGFDSSHSTNLTAKFDMCQLEYYPMNPFQEGKLPCVPSSNSNIHMNCRLETVFRGQKCSFSIFSQLGQKLFNVIESYGSGNSMFNSEVSH